MISPFSIVALTAITDLGDSAVLLAMTAVATVYLAWCRYSRAAWAVVATLFAAAGAIALLKVAFIGCSVHIFSLEIHSPSGHAALSSATFVVLSTVAASQIKGWARWLPLAVALVLVAAIAATRVILSMHTVDEVIVGSIVGLIAGMLGSVPIVRSTAPRFRLPSFLLVLILTMALMDGFRLPAEELIRYISLLVQSEVSFCA